MKNLQTFEAHEFEPYYSKVIKQYGDPFPFSKLTKGDRVTYMGTPGVIKEIDDYIMILTPIEGGSDIRINQNMFNQKGFIPNEYKPMNYNG
jgi:hypothetical protein